MFIKKALRIRQNIIVQILGMANKHSHIECLLAIHDSFCDNRP